MAQKTVKEVLSTLVKEVVFTENFSLPFPEKEANKKRDEAYKKLVSSYSKQIAVIRIKENLDEDNDFLANMSLSDLQVLKKEAIEDLKGWKNPDNSLDEKGKDFENKLTEINEVFDKKIERIYKFIAVE